ncbi:MAG: BrnT family toxin [Blautia sp.]|nr:BrnT family toxin [Blautia sp.]
MLFALLFLTVVIYLIQIVRWKIKLQFEWDEEKEKINIYKHGIDFETANRVFLDPNRLEYYDEVHSFAGEEQYITIGSVKGVLTVVYTERTKSLRIISARVATKKESAVLWQSGNMK